MTTRTRNAGIRTRDATDLTALDLRSRIADVDDASPEVLGEAFVAEQRTRRQCPPELDAGDRNGEIDAEKRLNPAQAVAHGVGVEEERRRRLVDPTAVVKPAAQRLQ